MTFWACGPPVFCHWRRGGGEEQPVASASAATTGTSALQLRTDVMASGLIPPGSAFGAFPAVAKATTLPRNLQMRALADQRPERRGAADFRRTAR